MSKPTRQTITNENEQATRTWFELSGFQSERLDKRGQNKVKTPDWRFDRQDLSVICEVKTIFSGGQQGLTREQDDRQRLEEKKLLERHASSLPHGQPLIMPRAQYDYIHGLKPFVPRNIPKEDEFQEFQDRLQEQLERDSDIDQLPFHITISIGGMYVPNGEAYNQF